MAFAIVHMQKIKANGVRGIQSHVHREHTPHTNPNIDKSRTAENYNVVECKNFVKKIKETIKNFAPKTKTVRKDAVVLCNFIVTSDEKTMEAMSSVEQRIFFNDTVRWFSERYGKENLINATVHIDETTPHMHLSVVPICDGRLSAKALFDRKELISLQTDFAKDVGVRYGLSRGKQGSERTHLSEQQYKLKTIENDLIVTERKQIMITAAINVAKRHREEMIDEVKSITMKPKRRNERDIEL